MTLGKNNISASSVSRFAYKSEIPVGCNAVRRIVSGVVLAALCAVSFCARAVITGAVEYNNTRYLSPGAAHDAAWANTTAHDDPYNDCPVVDGAGWAPLVKDDFVFHDTATSVYTRLGIVTEAHGGNPAFPNWPCNMNYGVWGQIEWTCASGKLPHADPGQGYPIGCYDDPPICGSNKTYNPSTGQCDAPLKNRGPTPCD